MPDDIATKLDTLYAFQVARQQIEADKSKLLDALIPDDVRVKMQEIEAEYGDELKAAAVKIAALETEIKQDVLKYGTSVKASNLQAVWSKPRVSWNTAELEGYAKAYPEILEMRSVGEPSVSIRKVNG